MKPATVCIVGAGISGLTAAFWLRRANIDVVVLEQESWPGGTMRTNHEEGWLIETGPNSALETTPLFEEMFRDLGLTAEREYANRASNRRYVLRNGKLHPIPMSPGAFLTSDLWTAKGKLRLLKEPFVGRAEREETIAEFVTRRLGKEFLDYAINPFVAGVYAGNPEELSVRSAFPKLYALEEKYGGLIMGMIKGGRERKQRAEKAKDRARMFSFKQGMQSFPDAMARRLGSRVRYGARVRSIEAVRAGSRIDSYRVRYEGKEGGGELEADAVVLSVPSYAAAGLVRPHSGSLADALEKIYYPPVAEVFMGLRLEDIRRPLDGFGFLIPAREQRNILGTIWSSAIFGARAPEGYAALTTFVGGSRQPHLVDAPETELVNLVLTDLRSIMQVTGRPVITRVVKWDRAIPQYRLGYGSVVREIERFESDYPGLHICSNYRGGIAVGDCVMNGERTASNVSSLLAERAPKSIHTQQT